MTSSQPVSIGLDEGQAVSGLLCLPPRPRALYVFAHGAGAGMTHAFMASFADGLAVRGIASLRYQFPSMEHGSKRPDSPAVAHAAVRAAVAHAAIAAPPLPLFAGGKSFGGRMTSQAQALAPLAGVRGLVFVGFPLHPGGKPSIARAQHLADVRVPMLFLQGTRDALAEPALLAPVVADLAGRATLHPVVDADHAFHVPKRSGRDDRAVLDEMLDTTAAWMRAVAGSAG